MAKLIAQGIEVTDLRHYEDAFKEGDCGYVEFDLRYIPSSDVIWNIRKQLEQDGVTLTKPLRMEGRKLIIEFQKASLPLWLIVAIIAASLFLIVLSWKLFKQDIVGLSIWVFVMVAGALVVLTFLAARGWIKPTGIPVGGAK